MDAPPIGGILGHVIHPSLPGDLNTEIRIFKNDAVVQCVGFKKWFALSLLPRDPGHIQGCSGATVLDFIRNQ